jgi:hypothetical protein
MSRSERAILADVKKLAVEYFEATGKPLGVTSEIAEVEAAEHLGLELVPARTPGYDALRRAGKETTRIQIKGRRILAGKPLYQGRVSKIDVTKPFDTVALVLLDARYDTVEIWEAPRAKVEARIKAPGSKARNQRGSLGISQFKSIAERVWSRVAGPTRSKPRDAPR